MPYRLLNTPSANPVAQSVVVLRLRNSCEALPAESTSSALLVKKLTKQVLNPGEEAVQKYV